MATSKKPEINKAQLIRDYLKENAEAMPVEVAKALTEKHGVEFTAQSVSGEKYKIQHGGKKPQPKPKPQPQPKSQQQPEVAVQEITVSSLIEIKKAIDRVGGIDQARKALDALELLR